MALPPINIVLKATTDGFRRGVSVVDGQLDKIEGSANSLQKRLITTGDRLTMVGRRMSIITAAATGAAAGMFAMAASAANAGDAIGDSAKAAGMSTTAFQEYRFAIKEAADMTDDEFAGSMVKLNKTLGDARDGSKSAIAAFEAIGVSQAQIADGSFDTDAALKAFVTSMEGITDPATAAAMAADLFGKSGARIGAGLAGVPGQVGALVEEARRLGIVLGEDTIKTAGEVDAKIKALGEQFEAAKLRIGATFLPFLNNTLLPFLEDTLIPGIESVIKTVIGWGAAFTDLPGPIQTALELVAVAIGAGGPVLLALGFMSRAFAVLLSTGPLGKFMLFATTLIAAWQIWGDDIQRIVGGAIDYLSKKFNEILAFFDRLIEGAKRVGTAIANAFSIGKEAMNSGEGYGGMGGAMDDSAAFTGGSNSSGGTFDIGASNADGLVDGFTTRMAERQAEIAVALGTVTTTAQDVFETHSPSEVFRRIGAFIGEGLAGGISESQAMVAQAVGTLGTAATQSTSSMVSGVLGSLGTLFNGSKKFAVAQALVNAWAGATEALKLPFPGNLAAFAKVLATGMSAVKNINSARPGSAGGAGGGGRGGGGGSAPAQAPTQTLNFTISNDPFGFGDRIVRQIASQLNEASRNGSNLRATVR